jgi:hypothetical protein
MVGVLEVDVEGAPTDPLLRFKYGLGNEDKLYKINGRVEEV